MALVYFWLLSLLVFAVGLWVLKLRIDSLPRRESFRHLIAHWCLTLGSLILITVNLFDAMSLHLIVSNILVLFFNVFYQYRNYTVRSEGVITIQSNKELWRSTDEEWSYCKEWFFWAISTGTLISIFF